jgi:hypothetical protein
MESFRSSSRADLALDDVEELTSIDPVQEGLGSDLLLLVQSRPHLFQTGFLVKETDQRKTIEDESFAHGGPLLDVHGGGRPSGRTCR